MVVSNLIFILTDTGIELNFLAVQLVHFFLLHLQLLTPSLIDQSINPLLRNYHIGGTKTYSRQEKNARKNANHNKYLEKNIIKALLNL